MYFCLLVPCFRSSHGKVPFQRRFENADGVDLVDCEIPLIGVAGPGRLVKSLKSPAAPKTRVSNVARGMMAIVLFVEFLGRALIA